MKTKRKGIIRELPMEFLAAIVKALRDIPPDKRTGDQNRALEEILNRAPFDSDWLEQYLQSKQDGPFVEEEYPNRFDS